MHSSSPDRPDTPTSSSGDTPSRPSDNQVLTTLLDLFRQVTSVLNLDELLQRIPQLISRLTEFSSFAVYLIDERRHDLSIAYSLGYPDERVRTARLKVGQGIVGAAVAEERPILVHDVLADPRYVEIVPGTRS
jgi:phosphoserine phosphatase RsbU/P